MRRLSDILKAALVPGLLTVFAHTLCAEHFNIQADDPAMIKQEDTYYLFCTGEGISVFSSKDMKKWESRKPVFAEAPAWAARLYPKSGNTELAPDISLHNGTYYLYYAVSTPGANNSTIAVATNRTLQPESPDFKWVDHGPIVESLAGRDMWNAIYPNVAFGDQGTPWLALGSYWYGIKVARLNADLTALAQPEEWSTVAARERYWKLEETDPGNDLSSAVESPFLFKKNGQYYLFASWDQCCSGVNSTSKVVVGRSDKITGPYLDKEGQPMRFGGGSLVVGGNKSWPGVGHNSVYTLEGKDYLVFQGYDASDQGRSKLWIQEIHWDADGWPSADLQ